MGLSCECDYDGEYYWEDPIEIKRFTTDRPCSCGKMESLKGKPGWKWEAWRFTEDGQMKFYHAASDYHLRLCEKCGDFYQSLEALGFCKIDVEYMFEDWKEYLELQRETDEKCERNATTTK